MFVQRVAVVFGFLLSLASHIAVAHAEEPWQALMSYAPSDANVLVMIHAEKVRTSGFAKTKGWNSADAAPNGLRSILPRGEVQRVVFASRLNLSDLAPRWEAGILETKSDSPLEVFAAGVGRPYENLGVAPGVRLPYDAYLLKLAPYRFGTLGPADRQKAAQWARTSKSPGSLDSTYLKKIASFPQTVGTEIMIGIDLADAVDVETVKQALRDSQTLRNAKIDADQAAQVITSIEGLALGVRVLDQATGMIRIDFTRDPALLTPVMKPLLLERLAARGAMIEDFNEWKLDMQGNTAFLGGTLSPEGLSLILGLVEPDLPPAVSSMVSVAVTPEPATPTKPIKPTVEKSKAYYAKVRDLVTGVRFPSSDLKIVSAGAFGAWIDRQARRIDMLPILGVDPDLLDYAQGTAKALRTTAAKQRGATITTSAYSGRTNWYNNGYQDYSYESSRQIQGRMENASANLSHVEIMRLIDDETADIRRRMTERYQVEF